MKLTKPEILQEHEKDFIDAINAELDWDAIEKLLLEKHCFTLQEEIDYKAGDLVVYDNHIAYKFDFEIKVPLSVIFNRNGDCLKMSTLRDDFEAENSAPLIHPKQEDKVAQMALNIADMISEINQEDDG
jgi:hypothetical protein